MPNPVTPWGYTVMDPPQPTPIRPEMYGPYQPTQIDAGEWSLESITKIPRSVASAVANAARLTFSSNAVAAQQGEPSLAGPKWYDIPGRLAATSSAINDAFQSTLIKVIVILAIVGVVWVFGMSYLQAKGANLAK